MLYLFFIKLKYISIFFNIVVSGWVLILNRNY